MAGVASPTPLNILAGIAGQGGTPNLAFFAPIGTALPTDPSTALDPAYLTAGYCSTDGLTISTNTSTQDIGAFGITVPARMLVTSATKTGTLSFLETNPVTQAVYRRLPLPGQTGGPTADTTGIMSVAEGPARVANYVGVFIATDGSNIIRKVAPNIVVTDSADEQIAQNSSISYGVTFTLLPDASGNTLYSYYLVPNLNTAP